jgi:hypothetical protein
MVLERGGGYLLPDRHPDEPRQTLEQQEVMRLTAPVVSEAELQEAVADALDVLLLPPAMWTAYPAGHIALTGQQAAKLLRMGLKRSWPDVLVLHGVLHGIELKRRGSALSKTRLVRTRRGRPRIVEGQADVFPRLEAAGMRLSTCETVEQVLSALTRWGIPLRRHT